MGDETVGAIEGGLTVFLAIMAGDEEVAADRMAQKILSLRIFDDEQGKFNYSVVDVAGGILLISNFTVGGDARKGSRPSFGGAAAPAEAERLYQHFAKLLQVKAQNRQVRVATGRFAADMQVLVENDGPVTILLEVA